MLADLEKPGSDLGAAKSDVSFEIPEVGQRVEVRRRLWVVEGVKKSTLSHQHIVTLVSLEDVLGETLSIVWELEPGVKVFAKANLPEMDGWDSSDRLAAFLDAVRWGAATDADHSLLQSPFRSAVEIQDFQLDPLVRAIDMPRVNLLIADDVGLGKTIEAGLVIRELLLRHRARTILIVCPASLQLKWQTEMHEKFGLEFRIVDMEYLRRLRRTRGIHVNPWTSFPRLITSMDWIKDGEGFRFLLDILPTNTTYPRKFDILVVDEAHNVAPSTANRYARPSRRTEVIRMLAPHFEHRLFLTATPHNGYQESFTSLLELLDDQRFVRGVPPNRGQLRRILVRRLKTDLVDEHGKPIYPRREIHALEIDYTDEEREVHRLLNEYIQEWNIERGSFSSSSEPLKFVLKLLKKRLFSSPRAFETTLTRHWESLSRREGGSRRGKGITDSGYPEFVNAGAGDDLDDDGATEDELEGAVDLVSQALPELTDKQKEILQKLKGWANRAKNRPDSKAKSIIRWLDEHLKTNGSINEKRVILFTEYRTTLSWLQEILVNRGWGGDRLLVLDGSILQKKREELRAAFQAHPSESPARILLATDAASEGIDLQNHCNYLIHVEIPWNPNVLEQRNGRIDRHGQKEPIVHIWHPVGKVGLSTPREFRKSLFELESDHEFLHRVVTKVNTIREDLGCVGPVIAQQIEERMLCARVDLKTSEAEVSATEVKRIVAAEQRLKKRVIELHDRLLEAREGLNLRPDRIARAVSVALEIAGKPPLTPTHLETRSDSAVYMVPTLDGSWAGTTRGLEHPYTGVRRPITFDHDIAKGRDDVVLAHLDHRLVQMALHILRAEVWAVGSRRKLKRVAFRSAPKGILKEPVIIVWSRLVIIGGGHHRLHEELTMVGGELKPRGFERIKDNEKSRRLLSSTHPLEPSERLFRILRDRYEKQRDRILEAVEDLSRRRFVELKKKLEHRQKSEESDLALKFDELEKTIRRELDRFQDSSQLELFSSEQREQIEKDRQALRRRLERIPEERVCEIDAIRRRYSNPVIHTFPIGIEFLVPDGFGGVR